MPDAARRAQIATIQALGVVLRLHCESVSERNYSDANVNPPQAQNAHKEACKYGLGSEDQE